MDIARCKRVRNNLLAYGVGFSASSFLGLDGIRESLSLPQLVIGIGLLLAAVMVNLIMIHCEDSD